MTIYGHDMIGSVLQNHYNVKSGFTGLVKSEILRDIINMI